MRFRSAIRLILWFCSNRSLQSQKTNRSVVILTWTSFFGSDLAVRFYMKGLAKCEYVCTATSNRSELTAAAAVVFHIRNIDPSDLPQSRSPRQLFAFYLLESPYHSGSALSRIRKDYFNITMTYRLDSDVRAAYGWMRPIDKSTTPDEVWKWKEIETIAKGKTKSVLILVSNCATRSKREVYVRALAKHIEVTRFGLCSKAVCDKKCAEEAIAQHYFYLAFENSVCRDYVTEKVFSYMEKIIVPIVLKRSFASSILPNGFFIAIDDFNSPASLAEHLKYLQSNKTEYMKYFEWAKKYRRNLSEDYACSLCRFLHKNSNATRVIADIGRWWYGNEMCIDDYAERLLLQKEGCLYRYRSRNWVII
uniref:Fucosyltransferase n=1 Tax=Ascaris lumbricoides TaxID=6252 RepID=A0A0M3IAZ5_ASCLU